MSTCCVRVVRPLCIHHFSTKFNKRHKTHDQHKKASTKISQKKKETRTGNRKVQEK
jgi:hypothetical protein